MKRQQFPQTNGEFLSFHNEQCQLPSLDSKAFCLPQAVFAAQQLHASILGKVYVFGFPYRRWCNLLVGAVLNVRFTTNGMCAKNNTHRFVAPRGNIRVISSGDLYCSLLPQCEALLLCRSGSLTPTVLSQRKFPNPFQYYVPNFL